MNTKIAKRLRKQLGYHPTDKRKFKRGNAGVVLFDCSRVEYKALKAQVK